MWCTGGVPTNELSYGTFTVAQSGLFYHVGNKFRLCCFQIEVHLFHKVLSEHIYYRNIPVSNLSPLLGVLCALSASSLHFLMC